MGKRRLDYSAVVEFVIAQVVTYKDHWLSQPLLVTDLIHKRLDSRQIYRATPCKGEYERYKIKP